MDLDHHHGKLITPTRRQFELLIAICKAQQVARQVEQLLGDKMDDLAQSASRRSSFSDGRKASALASWTSGA